MCVSRHETSGGEAKWNSNRSENMVVNLFERDGSYKFRPEWHQRIELGRSRLLIDNGHCLHTRSNRCLYRPTWSIHQVHYLLVNIDQWKVGRLKCNTLLPTRKRQLLNLEVLFAWGTACRQPVQCGHEPYDYAQTYGFLLGHWTKISKQVHLV